MSAPAEASGGASSAAQDDASSSAPRSSPVIDDDEMALIAEAAAGDDSSAADEVSDVPKFGVKLDVDDDDNDGEVASSSSSSSSASSAQVGALSPRRARAEERRRLVKEEMERQKQLREAQKQRLVALKEQQQAAIEEDREAKNAARLDFLTQQVEVFSHFVTGSSGLGGAGGAGAQAGAGKKKRGRKPKGMSGKAKLAAQAEAHAAAGGAASGGRKHRMTEAEEDEELLAESLGGGRQSVRIEKQPNNLVGGSMRDYQLEGLNWLVNLHDCNISGILADEMGLGKTMQSISLLAYLKEARAISGPHLVIVPKSTLGNWVKEFNRWCPSFKVLRLQGPKEERQRLVKEELMSLQYDVVVTSYEVVIIERAALRKFSWQYIVIDEAHRIKNENSALSREVRQLDSGHRLLLTGTPLQNNLHELWALLNFLLPDVFSSAEDFDHWFAGGDGSKQAVEKNAVGKLHAILKPFMLRRVKKDVAKELPPKIETKLFVGLTKMQNEWYRKLLSKDAASLNQVGGADKVRLLNILMQLRKCCNHPYLFDGAEPGPPFEEGPHLWENSGKMNLLHRLLVKLKAGKHRVLLFSQMTRMLDIFEDYCRHVGYNYCRIDGNTHGIDRDNMIEGFNEPDSDKFIFLLSTRAGGLGINLATADTVIIYDSDWNPQMDLQAMDRAHRIGQKNVVRVFRLVTEQTVEEKIVERAERKLYLDALVIQQGRLAQKEKGLSRGELANMVRFGADEIFRSGGSDGITDEDIDAILRKGEERTSEDKAKIQRDMQHTLQNYSMDDSKGDMSIYIWGGQDFADQKPKPGRGRGKRGLAAAGMDVGMLINLPQRERKRNYDIDQYYSDVMHGGSGAGADGKPAAPRGKPRLYKPPQMMDFQFFNRKRIMEIVEKQNDLLLARREIKAELKEVEQEENKMDRRWARRRKDRQMNERRAAKLAEVRAKMVAQGIEPSSGQIVIMGRAANTAALQDGDLEVMTMDPEELEKQGPGGQGGGAASSAAAESDEATASSAASSGAAASSSSTAAPAPAASGAGASEPMKAAADEEEDEEDGDEDGDADGDEDEDEGEGDESDLKTLEAKLLKKRRGRQRIDEDINDSVEDDLEARKAERAAKGVGAARLRAALEKLVLPKDEEEEKEKLLAEGFRSWTRRDFRAFMSACERHGRRARRAIIAEVSTATGKEPSEVARYFTAFWGEWDPAKRDFVGGRCVELEDWKKLEVKIAKGEGKIQRRDDVEREVAWKVHRYGNPFLQLQVPYGGSGKPTKGFNEEEDRFLLCMLNALGYGRWDRMQQEVRRAPMFRFDWFIKSRTTQELRRRCDQLIALVEKENCEMRGEEYKPTKQRKGRPKGSQNKDKGKAKGKGKAAAGKSGGRKKGKAASGAAGDQEDDEEEEQDDEEEEEEEGEAAEPGSKRPRAASRSKKGTKAAGRAKKRART